MNYGEVLSKAWKTIWKHKILWLFGFFASCAGGSGGGAGSRSSSNFTRDYRSDTEPWRHEPGAVGDISRFFNDFADAMQHTDAWVWILVVILSLLLLLIVSLLVHAVVTIGRNGLVYGAWQFDEGVEKLQFMHILRATLPYFWRVFLLYLVVSLIVLLFYLVLVLFMALIIFLMETFLTEVVFTVSMIIMVLFFLVLMLLAFLLTWIVDMTLGLAAVAIVGENMAIMDAVKQAWNIVRHKPVPVLLMGLILGIGRFFLNLIINIPMLLAFIPMLLGFLTFGPSDFHSFYHRESSYWLASLGTLLSMVCCCMYLPLNIALNSVVESYVGSAWTLTYRRLNEGTAVAAE